MKVPLLAILFVCALLAPGCSETAVSTEKWVTYDSPDGYISAKFPSAPKLVPQYMVGGDAPPGSTLEYGYRVDLITHNTRDEIDHGYAIYFSPNKKALTDSEIDAKIEEDIKSNSGRGLRTANVKKLTVDGYKAWQAEIGIDEVQGNRGIGSMQRTIITPTANIGATVYVDGYQKISKGEGLAFLESLKVKKIPPSN